MTIVNHMINITLGKSAARAWGGEKVKAADFDYVRPYCIEEVLAVLAEYGEDAKIIAGGQSLVPMLNMRFARPDVLVDINQIDVLSGIELLAGNRLRIGALTRHAAIASSDLIARHAPLLTKAAPYIAHEAIRNRGTIGGSLVTADPAAEWPACCLALNARIVLRSQRGERTVAAEDFFQGVYETATEPDELLVAVEIPVLQKGQRIGFAELARRKGDYAIVGLAAQGEIKRSGLLRRGEAHFHGMKLAFFGVADKPVLAQRAAAALEGQALTPEVLQAAQSSLAEDIETMADLYTSAAAKSQMARVLLGRVVAEMYQEKQA